MKEEVIINMDKKMTIMIIEDDETLAYELRDYLMKWDYHCITTRHFENILHEYLNFRPHLILMDINLPYYDGFYWCHQIREISEVPIIYISSRNDDKDKIMAMAQGGDDYIEKPFHLELFKAKIDAILRRTYQYQMKERILVTDTIIYDITHQSLYMQDREIELTKSEKRIMNTLINAKGKIVTREELMMELWSTDEFISDGTLNTVMSRLRHKLKQQCKYDMILTKKGMGYYIA